MKNLALAAAVTVAVLAASVSSVRAQDNKPMVQPGMSGAPTMMVPMKMSAADEYKAMWVNRNLDMREVKRYRAEGLTDATIKGAANIALRTDLPLEHIVRLLRESGYPLATIATMHGVPPKVVKEDIPGYGLEYMGVMSPGMMDKGMMQPGMAPGMTPGMQPGMTPPPAMAAPAPQN